MEKKLKKSKRIKNIKALKKKIILVTHAFSATLKLDVDSKLINIKRKCKKRLGYIKML